MHDENDGDDDDGDDGDGGVAWRGAGGWLFSRAPVNTTISPEYGVIQWKFRSTFRHSFAVRTVGDWNLLPSHVVEQSTTASFKAELSRLTSTAYAP